MTTTHRIDNKWSITFSVAWSLFTSHSCCYCSVTETLLPFSCVTGSVGVKSLHCSVIGIYSVHLGFDVLHMDLRWFFMIWGVFLWFDVLLYDLMFFFGIWCAFLEFQVILYELSDVLLYDLRWFFMIWFPSLWFDVLLWDLICFFRISGDSILSDVLLYDLRWFFVEVYYCNL